MTSAAPPTGFLHLVVGYDGSPPAIRALDGAVRLLQGRIGRIAVVYVAYLSSVAMLSPGAITEIEKDFDEIEQELRTQAAEQLRASGAAWEWPRTRPGTHARFAWQVSRADLVESRGRGSACAARAFGG
jgi:nucleotide-binding universal stress UspA family protein